MENACKKKTPSKQTSMGQKEAQPTAPRTALFISVVQRLDPVQRTKCFVCMESIIVITKPPCTKRNDQKRKEGRKSTARVYNKRGPSCHLRLPQALVSLFSSCTVWRVSFTDTHRHVNNPLDSPARHRHDTQEEDKIQQEKTASLTTNQALSSSSPLSPTSS